VRSRGASEEEAFRQTPPRHPLAAGASRTSRR
jgi:hypothetical protein